MVVKNPGFLRLLLFLLIVLPMMSAANCIGFPTTSVLDNFSGGDELPITTNWTGGITGTGDCDRENDRLENRSGAGDESCYYDVSTFGQKQELFFTIPNAASWSLDVTARAHLCLVNAGTAAFNGYGLRIRPVTGAGNDIVTLFRTASGGYADIGSSYAARDFADGDKYAIVIDGSNFGTEVIFEVFLSIGGGGWSSIITHTESTTLHDCTGTHLGFELPNTTHAVDDVGGGNTVVGGGSNNLLGILPIFFD